MDMSPNGPSSKSSSSNNGGSDRRFMLEDPESLNSRPRRMVWIWKVPLPLRKFHVASDLIKNIALLLTLACIAQLVYIVRLRESLVRIPNDSYDNTFWGLNRQSPAIWDSERQSFLRNVLPVLVHSHNDYWRSIPLFEALGSGCTSVEADVHLTGSDLLVGHSSHGLHAEANLRNMYLDPLKRMIDAQNKDLNTGAWRGLFNLDPQQTLVLLIDHKTAGAETFAELYAQLQPFRDNDYLTYWDGKERIMRPLTVVATRNAPFESVLALNGTHRDIFWDAPLEMLPSVHDDFSADPVVYDYNRSNSYFASTNFYNAKFHAWPVADGQRPETPQIRDMNAAQIDQANARGLLSRYWGSPSEPANLQEVVWRFLVQQKVDIMNMDDMDVVRARAHGWGRLQRGSLRNSELELR